ncbi:MAG TPA: ParM/StbA family protein [Thermosynechococcaceae cyanobacterium]
MLPDVIEISPETLKTHFQLQPFSAQPEQSAWITESGRTTISVVGSLAKTLYSVSQLKALKYESAIAKILAVVGAIAQTHQLPSSFNLSLLTLLPYNESSSVKLLEPDLKKRLKRYQFRDQSIKVQLQTSLCYPEGAGLVAAFVNENPQKQSRRIAVCMIGHRNTSLLQFQSGQLTEGHTSDLGFHNFIEILLRLTSGQNETELTPVLYDYLLHCCHDPQSQSYRKTQSLRPLLKSRQPQDADRELQQLQEAIEQAYQEYWRRLSAWLTEFMPRPVDEVIFAGGASQCLKPQLDDFTPNSFPHWGSELQKELIEQFYRNVPSNSNRAIVFRSLDCYGSFVQLQSLVKEAA